MNISAKLKDFFAKKNISNKPISVEYGVTRQNISQILTGERKVPIDFVIWAATTYPDLDLEFLFRDNATLRIVAEGNTCEKTITKEQMMKDFSMYLDKYV